MHHATFIEQYCLYTHHSISYYWIDSAGLTGKNHLEERGLKLENLHELEEDILWEGNVSRKLLENVAACRCWSSFRPTDAEVLAISALVVQLDDGITLHKMTFIRALDIC